MPIVHVCVPIVQVCVPIVHVCVPIVHVCVLQWQTCGVHVECSLVPRSSFTPGPLSVQE